MPPELPPSLQGLIAKPGQNTPKVRDYSRVTLELTPERAMWVLGIIKKELDGLSKTSTEFAEVFAVYRALRDKIGVKTNAA